MRRSNRPPGAGGILQLGALRLGQDRHAVTLRDQAVELTPTEFDMLKLLLSQPGRVFTRLQLLEAAQGVSYEGYERSVDVHIKNLRHKLKRLTRIQPTSRPCLVWATAPRPWRSNMRTRLILAFILVIIACPGHGADCG